MNLTGRKPVQKPEKCRLSAAEHRKHVEAVKSLPCVVCQAPPPSDAHHCICDRYGTKKPCDCHTIPLCRVCHLDGPNAIHNGKESWVARYGKDYDYLEETRARVRPD